VDRTMERGVKVKWPSKRMSVGDMNKRVRALVEWVGREQASSHERGRRREALEAVLREAAEVNLAVSAGGSSAGDADGDPGGGDASMVLDREEFTESPVQEKAPRRPPSSVSGFDVAADSQKSTMTMMEELMKELIGFQERFGPGAKGRERERRAAAVS